MNLNSKFWAIWVGRWLLFDWNIQLPASKKIVILALIMVGVLQVPLGKALVLEVQILSASVALGKVVLYPKCSFSLVLASCTFYWFGSTCTASLLSWSPPLIFSFTDYLFQKILVFSRNLMGFCKIYGLALTHIHFQEVRIILWRSKLSLYTCETVPSIDNNSYWYSVA